MHGVVMLFNHASSSNLVLIPLARDLSPERFYIYATFRIPDVLLMSQTKRVINILLNHEYSRSFMIILLKYNLSN